MEISITYIISFKKKNINLSFFTCIIFRMTTAKKLRILCLHGMVQNAAVFRKKTSVIRKKLDKIADLVYVTAPQMTTDPKYTSEAHRAAAADENAPEEEKPFAWWHPYDDKQTEDGYYMGFKESVQHLKDIMIKEGPFDGIFGFSQGACLAGVMLACLEDRSLAPTLFGPDFDHPNFKFAILAAGFKPFPQKATQNIWTHKISTPTLFMIGEEDKLITPALQETLVEQCIDPVIIRHSGGHVVPSNAASRNETLAFVSKFANN
ncbi:serine hydrolase FSH [Cokeromyces recurvatus]|uniref:serine hydrolase FSH n=1 Tax=Cokeromyces recurvatus TaxID=90255 RepID=UPI00221F05FA|nr:serine hydrolase FSH [Cokeromyces recurvatus]KAI7904103.1 serine hydrolase FSH [Cokeromyces recurvatus]